MRLIDADKLHPDCMTKDGKIAISQRQIAEAPVIDPRFFMVEDEIAVNRSQSKYVVVS